MTQSQEFMKQVEKAIGIFREWEKLTYWEKLCRLEQKPSFADYRILNMWMQRIAFEPMHKRMKNG